MKIPTKLPVQIVGSIVALLACAIANAALADKLPSLPGGPVTPVGRITPTPTPRVNPMGGLPGSNVPSFGPNNTATGLQALASLQAGRSNTADGVQALANSTDGNDNTAVGSLALFSDTEGSANTVSGTSALFANTSGSNNVAIGYDVMPSNTIGSNNVALGLQALGANQTGGNNTACGTSALFGNTTGSNNIAIGGNAGKNLTTGSNNIEVFDPGAAGDANTIRLGTVGTQSQTFVAGISGTAVTGGAVVVNSSGQLGVAPSSRRFKEDILDMGTASEAILALRPVTFRYRPGIDPTGAPQFGLVAEEVEQVSPDLVTRDADHQVYSVRYDAVNAMLLNEFRKQHDRVEEQGRMIANQQNAIAVLTARLDAMEKAAAR
jgi:hypothetical protein